MAGGSAAGRGAGATVRGCFTHKTADFLEAQAKTLLKWPCGQLGGASVTVPAALSADSEGLSDGAWESVAGFVTEHGEDPSPR